MENYYLGLDLGTNSIGWALTDSSYRLIRKKGKDMWGIREFEEANTAAERRSYRVSRRRRQKEVVRLGLLKSFFADEIEKVDPFFFARIENSKFYLEDKEENVRCKNVLFNDSDFSDSDYYSNYKTIFHLRKELIENTDAHDVRLVYLAVANMFKHRGHFLNDNLSSADNARSMQAIYDAFVEETQGIVIDPESEDTLSFASVDAEKIEDILSDKSISRKAKAEQLAELLKIEKKDKVANEYVKCICGLKTDAQKLFPELETTEKIEICFSDFGYEDRLPEIINCIGDENNRCLELMKEMYDAGILSAILKGKKYLSFSRVENYEKHRYDLKLLQDVIKKYKTKEDYDYMFRSAEPGSYSAYVNSVNSEGIKVRRGIGSYRADDIYASIKKLLKDIDDKAVQYILNEIDNENFLPKQLTSSNGVIPNQVHKAELAKILTNAENYLPFLKEKDESGLSVSQRILELFSFHVPYYIGPVTEKSAQNGGNGWVIRKEEGTVFPWNYKDLIDINKTSESFVERMVRNCSYIKGEKVLPKSSLMYESFSVLNEINKIKVDGERIDNNLKQDIYNDLFKSGKKVSRSKLCKYLVSKSVIVNDAQISGIDKDINNYLSSYGKFKSIVGEDIEKDDVKCMIERIIFLCTVYGNSSTLLKEAITKEFGDALSPEQIKRIIGYKFKEWGRLSKDFFELSGVNVETGEIMSLYRALWDTNLNLMELLNREEYGYKEALNNRATSAIKLLNEFEYDDLDEYYFSAPVKRMVWQSLLLIKEIKGIMESEPSKIFIEMTREEGEKGDKGRKDSRKKKFLDLYKNIDDESHEWIKLIEESEASGKLRSKKMYLYLTQMGKDMYTGKDINLDDLFKDGIYNIDHIYPQSVTKDDNIENNLVLVHGNLNREKDNEYPLNSKILDNQAIRNHWKYLHEKKFINDEKYARLTSRKPLTEEQLAGFIERQLVETSQAAKGVADILKGVCPNSKLVYSKAGNVSDFRRDYGFLKTRVLNDFHHANDAYLNIVVGNAYNIKFTDNPLNFIKKDYLRDKEKHSYHMSKMFKRDIVRGDKIGWIAPKDGDLGSLGIVKTVLSKNTPMMTMMETDGSGALFNLQPISHHDAKSANYAPLKSSVPQMSNVEKYGGYGSLKPAYFVFLEYGKEKSRKRAFDVIPMIYKDNINADELAHFFEKNGYENVKVLVSKIKRNSLIKIDGYYMYLVGMDSRKNVELHNAVNMKATQMVNNYAHDIEKSVESGKVHERITAEKNLFVYNYVKEKYTGEGIMSKYPKNIGNILINGEDKFIGLPLFKQIEVLYKILTISSINGKVTELKDIGGPSSDVGRIRISGNMTDRYEVKLIKKSVTGVFEKGIDLLKI